MKDIIRIEYKLTGAGWADCTVSTNTESVIIVASYLSDALSSLADAVLIIARGAKSSQASFEDEPGEYRWKFDATDEDNVLLRIIEFNELWSGSPNEDGKIIFKATTSRASLVRSMIKCLSDILEKHSIEEYKEKWIEHEFPLIKYNELRSVLNEIKKRHDE